MGIRCEGQLVAEPNADENGGQLWILGLIRAEVAARAALGIDAVLRIEPGVLRPPMQVAPGHGDCEGLCAETTSEASLRVEREGHLPELREVRRADVEVLQLAAALL